MARACGSDIGRIIDRLMVFFRSNKGDGLAGAKNIERIKRVKLKNARVSTKTEYHLLQMARVSGMDVGQVIDYLMVFYRENGGDKLADERTRERSLLGRKAH